MTESRGSKFVTTIVLVFKKIEMDDKTRYDTFYSNSKAEIIINETDIDDVFQSICTTIISYMKVFRKRFRLESGSGSEIRLLIQSLIPLLIPY